jgi:hypothetical protein
MPRPSSGGLNVVQVDAAVFGRRKYVEYTGMFLEFVHSELRKT